MTELKPCPFCGGEAELTTITVTGYDFDKPSVRCKECYVDNGLNDNDSEAINA